MPNFKRTLPDRTLLRALVLVLFVIGAGLALRLLMTPSGAPARGAPGATVAGSAASPTPARLAAATATAAAVRALAPAVPASVSAALKPTNQELSTIKVIVTRNDTLDHIFRQTETDHRHGTILP